MVNLVGEAGHSGEACYEGISGLLKIENAFLHLYGKRQTRPGRKMGHVTILSADKTDLVYKAKSIKQQFHVISKQPI
jgi:5-(carboxyamino)imidazole ribonucleotide synthase